MPSKIIAKNNGSEDILIPELGQVVAAGSEVDLTPPIYLIEKIVGSSLYTLAQAGSLVVNDGVGDLSIGDVKTLLEDYLRFRFSKYNLQVFTSAFGSRTIDWEIALYAGFASKSSTIVSVAFPAVARMKKMTKAEKDEVNSIHSSNQMLQQFSVVPLSFAAITNSPAAATNGEPYSWTATADASVTVWSVVEGTLPDGLSLNASTGEISGTPTTPGTYNFTLETTRTDPYLSAPFNIVKGAKDVTITVT